MMEHHGANGPQRVNLVIDNINVTAPAGSTILEAAKSSGVTIPTLCNFKGLLPRAVCRLCVVELDGAGRLKPACATEVYEGAKVVTNSLELHNLRKTIVELLLDNHPDDCLVCPRNLGCELQTLALNLGITRLHFTERAPVQLYHDGKTLVRDMERCVKCGRCVSVCQNILKVQALTASQRSWHYEIAAPFRTLLSQGPCVYCGSCISVCPVGAIYEKDDCQALLEALDNEDITVSGSFSREVLVGLEAALGYGQNSLKEENLSAALRRLGFTRIYPREFFLSLSALGEAFILREKIEKKEGVISLCSLSIMGFFKEYYPNAVPLISQVPRAQELLAAACNGERELSSSILPCVSQKYAAHLLNNDGRPAANFNLTTSELIRIFKLISFNLTELPLSPLDIPTRGAFRASELKEDTSHGMVVTDEILYLAKAIYFLSQLGESGRAPGGISEGIFTLPISLGGKEIELNMCFGMAAAIKLLDAMGKGAEFNYIKIFSCPNGCRQGGGQAREYLKGVFPKDYLKPRELIVPIDSYGLFPLPELPWQKEAIAAFSDYFPVGR
ncbi:MAG: (2Fe-2S)-binding protein [Deltaproteobacteria bacterium]|jgi:NADH-quinone oxidoreductase subunit G/NADP-reducing hydrogenase subunit HndD|nr:(2Fe-2S)-binding protein [Deltaproteobacteria bacterium]